MAKFPNVDSQAEALGAAVMPFLTISTYEGIQHLVEKHGFAEVHPDGWYPAQSVMDLLRDIEEECGDGMMDFVSIGMRTIEEAVFPPEFEKMSFEQIIAGWNEAYQMNYRGGDLGQMVTEFVDEQHVRVISTVPWPDDMSYGTLYGAARRFLPDGSRFVVRYDDEEPRRDEGGERTIIHIEWD